MAQQNIHYELTKQQTSQSMRSQGAHASYKLLDRFLRAHCTGIVYKQASLRYFVWVDDRDAIKDANKLEQKLFSDFGTQKKRSRVFGIFRRRGHYEEVFDWDLDGDTERHLGYVDDLGALPSLKPRPPLCVGVSVDFWLKGAEKTDAMKSHAIAWFSPTSNTACFTFNFPHTLADDDFVRYRKALQADCPVMLDDKFFYARKAKGSNNYSFRKMY